MKHEKFKFGWKSHLLLYKKYFDTGYGHMHYLKLIITVFGVSWLLEGGYTKTIFWLVAYAGWCYLFGWVWIKWHWLEADMDLNNYFDVFVRQVRRKL